MRKRLLVSTLSAFALRAIALGLTLLSGILLARLLGPSGYGIYTYSMAWVSLLAIPATLGLDKLIVREVAACQVHNTEGLIQGLLQWSQKIVLCLSVGLVIIGASVALPLTQVSTETLPLVAFCLALIALPISCLRSLKLAAIRGLHQVGKGLLPEMLGEPFLLIGGASLLSLFLGDRLSPLWLIGIHVVSILLTLGLGTYLLHRSLPEVVRTAAPQYQIRTWLNSAIPLMLLDGMQVINARIDILMLGIIQDSGSVGIYSAVIRGTQLITFGLVAVNLAIAPVFSRLYAENQRQKLYRLYLKSSWLIILSSVPIATLLIVFRTQYLALFGPEFASGATAIIFLSIGQLFNAATGSAGVLLNMTGYERYTVASLAISALLNCVGNFLLIPQWGMNGAAIATACSLIIVNLLKATWIQQKFSLK